MNEVDYHMSLRIRDVPLELPLRLLRERDTCSVYRDGRDSGAAAAAATAATTAAAATTATGEGGGEGEATAGSDVDNLESCAGEIMSALGLNLSCAALEEVYVYVVGCCCRCCVAICCWPRHRWLSRLLFSPAVALAEKTSDPTLSLSLSLSRNVTLYTTLSLVGSVGWNL